MGNNNYIVEKIYIKGNIKLLSPLLISGGEENNTDKDIIRNWDGDVFIPASSISGVIRSFFYNNLKSDTNLAILDELFGKKGKESTQSLITFYDSFLVDSSKVKIEDRDGIRINHETKTTEKTGKFEYEVLSTNSEFEFRIEFSLFDNLVSKKDQFISLLYLLIKNLQDSKIYLGAKSKRGFGKIKLDNTQILYLNLKNKQDQRIWLNFDWKKFSGNKKINDLNTKKISLNDNVKTIKIDYSIPYSLIIKHYNDNPKESDVVHITSNGNPVIPASSWNGAIRHSIKTLSKVLVKEDTILSIEEDLFGYVEKELEKNRASRIRISESTIKNSISMDYTRNKIDRFTASVVDSALFSERAVYGGKTTLEIDIYNPKDYEIGLILLSLKDISNGIQTIGGDSNIGRGILKMEKITINNEHFDESKYFESLYKEINK